MSTLFIGILGWIFGNILVLIIAVLASKIKNYIVKKRFAAQREQFFK